MNIINSFTDWNFWINFFNNPTNIIFLIIILLIIIYKVGHDIIINKRIRNVPGFKFNQKVIKNINNLDIKVSELMTFKASSEMNFQNLFQKNKEMHQVKIIRYNPYQDMGVGGNQSFSLGIINKNGNGVIITSLYSRERTRVLSKNVVSFQTEQELSEEEKKLLKMFKN